MIILGLDPGIDRLGFAYANARRGSFVPAQWDGGGYAFGIIATTKGDPEPARLAVIYRDMRELLATIRPDAVAIETLFAGKNSTSVIPVAQARGVAVAICAAKGIPVHSYYASSIKKTVAGSGKATKPDMRAALEQQFPQLRGVTRVDDADDALAIAYTHFLTHEHAL